MPVDFNRSVSLGDIAPAAADAGEVAFHVGDEHRHADPREMIGEHLQRDRLAGAGGAGDQPVAVGERGTKEDVAAGGGAGDQERFAHVVNPRCCISNCANSGPLPSSSCLKYT